MWLNRFANIAIFLWWQWDECQKKMIETIRLDIITFTTVKKSMLHGYQMMKKTNEFSVSIVFDICSRADVQLDVAK